MSERLLFQKLPSTLFSPLAAPEAVLYSEVLLVLFQETQRHQEPLSRELCVTLVVDVIEDQHGLELLAYLDEGHNGSETSDVRSKAADVLRYLTRCGWLREEIQGDFTIAFIIPDYAFRVLSVFHELATDSKQPLQGIICAIHDLLQAAVRQGNTAVRIPQVYQETMRLLNGLKELQHNINTHIETVLNQASLRDILEQTFTSRLHQVTRRAYHELRTTDHVSRFRPGINEALAALSTKYQDYTADTASQNGTNKQQNASVQRIPEQIENIQAQFDTLDTLLDIIDARHSQFFDSAVRSIEHRLSANTSTSGHLRTILEHLLATQQATSVTAQSAHSLEQVDADALVHLYSLALLDEKSLMSPRKTPEPFIPDPDVSSELSEQEKRAAQEQTLAQLSRALSRERVRMYANTLLADCDKRRMGDIALNGPDDLPMLIYLRLYGQDGSLGYLSEELVDAPWIERAGIGFRDFLIRRVKEAPMR